MKNNTQFTGILIVAISAASFGVMPIFTKTAYSAGTSTYTLLFLRFLIAAVFLFSLLFIRESNLVGKNGIGVQFSRIIKVVKK